MDTQSVAPSGTELAKKTFTPGSSNAPLSAHGKRGAAAGQLECRQSTVSCSFTFEGRNRRGGHSDHQLSKSIPHYGSTASGGEADRNSWLVGSRGPAHASFLWPFSFGRGKRRLAPERRKRVMVLMSDTGGGHRASAEALQAGFEQLYGNDFQVDYVDVWTNHTPYPFNQLPKTYSFMVRNSLMWRIGYYGQQPRFIHVPTQTVSSLFVSKQVAEAFDQYQPDLVVSVHPLMQLVPLRVLRQQARRGKRKPVPFATVVTDLTTCHNTWFHPLVDRCFVPTLYCKRSAMKNGLKEEQITVHGLPIRPAFSRNLASKQQLRKRLGLDQKLPIVLLVGGGEGMGAIEKTLEALDERVGGACQVVAICGRNKALIERLSNRSFSGGLRVKVRGFVTNMAEWMTACDTIITKAGPGTIAEALICGLPIILNGFIPCQEEGNVPFVVDNKVGLFERKPAAIAAILQRWLTSDEAEYNSFAERAREIGSRWKGALLRIVVDLAIMCDSALEIEAIKADAQRALVQCTAS
ncbi:g8016 [Coccomyxa viridis]|uniref:monogalactosyldiacylglycerol synthase n=1 Tax=Coccomyxa viridis TaxID=1274662 RepID=A0ABP1FZF5_9CHLO